MNHPVESGNNRRIDGNYSQKRRSASRLLHPLDQPGLNNGLYELLLQHMSRYYCAPWAKAG